MSRRAAVTALCLLAAVAGCGGGGGDDGDGLGGNWELAPTPLAWEAGETFGFAIFDVPQRDPSDFGDPTCKFTGQLAEASEAAEFPRSDEEGACIVTTATDLRGLAPDPTPACAGVFVLEFADRSPRITACPDSMFASPTEVDCDSASSASEVRITSGPNETEGDRISGLDVTLDRPEAPVITAPDLLPSDAAQWPAGGDLTVRWAAEDPSAGNAVEVVLRQLDAGGPMVRCVVEDAGEAVIPGRLVGPYRDAEATVEVARLVQARGDVDGFDFRATARTSDTFRLVPP